VNMNKDDKIIKDILSKATEQKAPSNMSFQVLEAWKKEQSQALAVKPIMPKWLVWTMGLSVVSAVVWFLFTSSESVIIPDYASGLSSTAEGIGSALSSVNMYTVMSVLALGIMVMVSGFLINSKSYRLKA
jgi:hypothetical protein